MWFAYKNDSRTLISAMTHIEPYAMPSATDDSSGNQQVVDIYYDNYARYVKTYKKICLLMQVGGFYEIYCTKQYENSNAREVCSDLDMRLVVKDPRNSNSAYMAGFPIAALDYKVKSLLDKGYTVIVMDQGPADLDRPSARRDRKVTRVISAATDLDSTLTRNNVVSIYCERYRKGALSFGLCAIDTTVSREVLVHEIHSVPGDKGLALDTAVEFISQQEPLEVIIVTSKGEKNQAVVKQLGITCPIHYMDIQTCRGKSDQVESSVGVASYAANALDGLLTFLEDHCYRLQDVVVVPFHSERYLDLSSTAIIQLDVSLLYDVLDETMTAMGTRFLRERLVRPLLSPQELEETYSAISELSEDAEGVIREGLRGLPDLDRLHRKLSLGRLQWSEMRSLHSAYTQALSLLIADQRHAELTESLSEMIENYSRVFLFSDVDSDPTRGAASNAPLTFHPGRFPDLDSHVGKKQWARKVIDAFMSAAKTAVPCETYKMKDTLGLQTTHLRADAIKKKVRRSSWKVRKLSGHSYVYSEELETALAESRCADEEIYRLQKLYFDAYVAELYATYGDMVAKVSRALAELDFLQCAKFLARTRRLSKPELVSDRCLLIRELRHLVIEDLNPDTRYVPNDCLLACDTEGNRGMIGMALYGLNACGKSSYLKAVGLAVIMAQAGMFVPAASMVFKPFKRIMTRIAGGDSIEKGQSSFIVELNDLGSVISRADKDSLILGDEMCRGTEVASAEALVYTTLQTLATAGVPFVTASHLHGIADDIKQKIPRASVFHMEVSFDKDGDPIYDRKLLPGPGASYYGLEIARAQGFKDSFMQIALDFRNQRLPTKVTEGSRSRYNAQQIRIACEACGAKPVGKNALSLDTHHLNFQCNADKDGYHGTQRRDALHNLISLCKACHIKVHSNRIQLIVQQSLKGRKVTVEDLEPSYH